MKIGDRVRSIGVVTRGYGVGTIKAITGDKASVFFPDINQSKTMWVIQLTKVASTVTFLGVQLERPTHTQSKMRQ